MSTLTFQPEADRYYAEGWWRDGDLWDEFAARASEAPDKVALILEEGDITYAQLRRAALALSARLADLSAAPGDAVILLGRHSIGAVVALLGCLHRGLVVAPLPPIFGLAQLTALSAQMGAKGIVSFGGEREIDKCRQAGEAVDFVLGLDDATIASLFAEDAPAARRDRDADDLTLVLHSSGTT